MKWAGGKSQLLPALRARYPAELRDGQIRRYVEPFLGGGAVFFDVMQGFDVEEAHLFDANEELILAYAVIQRDPDALIGELTLLRAQYLTLDETERAALFYAVREQYNAARRAMDFDRYAADWIVRAAQMIFLNKTCFNGLHRVNSAGLFNVPFGATRNPVIFDEENLHAVSKVLGRATLHQGPYIRCAEFTTGASFVYFDPPYRPLSQTASFTAYSRDKFGDVQQRELAVLFASLARNTDARLMLSNSDPRHADPNDAFFDDLYAGFTIERVLASRMINSRGEGRGKITEIVVTNYEPHAAATPVELASGHPRSARKLAARIALQHARPKSAGDQVISCNRVGPV